MCQHETLEVNVAISHDTEFMSESDTCKKTLHSFRSESNTLKIVTALGQSLPQKKLVTVIGQSLPH